MIEEATETIRISPELLADLATWSEPVQVRAEKIGDEWVLIFRLVSAQTASMVFARIMSE